MPTPLHDSLVNKMISSDDATFEAGLTDAVSLVKRGDETGLQAIKEAIIRLSGRRDFVGYKPGFTVRLGEEYGDARPKLLNLAKKGALLKDPHETQNLISAFKFLSEPPDFSRLVTDVYKIRPSEAHALLLLSNEMWCWIQLSRNGPFIDRSSSG